MREIEFFGLTISKDGIRPSEDKVKSIKDFAVPSKTKELSSFPGTITYFAKSIPNLSSKTETLRRLPHKDQRFIWGQEENDVFIHLKSKLCSDTVMAHFNTSLKTSLIVDAGPVGLGAILAQEQHDGTIRPVAFASRTLTAVCDYKATHVTLFTYPVSQTLLTYYRSNLYK